MCQGERFRLDCPSVHDPDFRVMSRWPVIQSEPRESRKAVGTPTKEHQSIYLFPTRQFGKGRRNDDWIQQAESPSYHPLQCRSFSIL
jgi:hypothetical protein